MIKELRPGDKWEPDGYPLTLILHGKPEKGHQASRAVSEELTEQSDQQSKHIRYPNRNNDVCNRLEEVQSRSGQDFHINALICNKLGNNLFACHLIGQTTEEILSPSRVSDNEDNG